MPAIEKSEKAPKSAAQRKAAQRARLKAQGLVKVRFPETWATPAQAKEIELKAAQAVCAAIKGESDENNYINHGD